MLMKYLLVLVLLLVVSFALLSAQNLHSAPTTTQSSSQSVTPVYSFDVFGSILRYPQCTMMSPYYEGSFTIIVHLKENRTEIFNGTTRQFGTYRETIYVAGTPDKVTLEVNGHSVTKAFTSGAGGEIELNLNMGGTSMSVLQNWTTSVR